MNCAPITVTGGGNDNSVIEKLPDMFVANIPFETCNIPENFNYQFPNPGDSVETREAADIGTSLSGDYASMTKMGAGAGTLGSAGSSTTASAPAATSAVSTPAATSNPGGVFAPGASSAAAPTSFANLAVTNTAAASAAPSSVVAPIGGTGVGTAPAASSTCVPCSNDGAVVCIGTTQFGLCNHGCAMPQDLASGTTCSNGTTGKRSIVRRIPPNGIVHRRHAAQKL